MDSQQSHEFCRSLIISIMKLNTEENGAVAKGNRPPASYLPGNLLDLLLSGFLIW